MWTSARVTRLKKEFYGQKEKEGDGMDEDPPRLEEKIESNEVVVINLIKE